MIFCSSKILYYGDWNLQGQVRRNAWIMTSARMRLSAFGLALFESMGTDDIHAEGSADRERLPALQSLVANDLRDRVMLRVDGGLRNGRDVLVLAAMGGDEFGFGTVAMIATGCIMARVCHTNNCPVGVASQREELRARFPGTPGDLVRHPLFLSIFKPWSIIGDTKQYKQIFGSLLMHKNEMHHSQFHGPPSCKKCMCIKT